MAAGRESDAAHAGGADEEQGTRPAPCGDFYQRQDTDGRPVLALVRAATCVCARPRQAASSGGAAFNRAVGGNGSVGIFHEPYSVRAGDYECVYVNMPPFGMARAGAMVPAVGRMQSAMSRMGRAEVE